MEETRNGQEGKRNRTNVGTQGRQKVVGCKGRSRRQCKGREKANCKAEPRKWWEGKNKS